MFSSHLPKVKTISSEHIFAAAGLLLVVGMLMGLAMVASGQVKKAELRDSQIASQRTAVVNCMQTLGGDEMNKCMVQAQATPEVTASRATTMADNSGSAGSFTRSSGMSVGASQGLLPVSFSTHR